MGDEENQIIRGLETLIEKTLTDIKTFKEENPGAAAYPLVLKYLDACTVARDYLSPKAIDEYKKRYFEIIRR